ncbi:unnamed protein product [Ascophyllum nodosum]
MDSHLLSHPDVRLFFYAFLLLLGIYVSVMCTCFGTLSIRKAKSLFREYENLEQRYDATFQRRDDVLHHIGGARNRGEHDQAALLEKQLARVDGDLDVLEQRLQDLDERHSSNKRPKKM